MAIGAEAVGDQRLVLGQQPDASGARSRFNLHMLSPILLGLAAPMLVIGLIDPAGLRPGRVMVFALLGSLFLVATVLFAVSLLWQGEITAVVFDKQRRKIEFVQSGLLANISVEVHFDQVAAIGVAARFDRDGYPFTQAEIELRDGQRVALPAGTTTETIAAARRALGL
jgi:hypothetical protein